jgi:hypothetical protein
MLKMRCNPEVWPPVSDNIKVMAQAELTLPKKAIRSTVAQTAVIAPVDTVTVA